MTFKKNDTVLIIPIVDLGNVCDVKPNSIYEVKCYTKKALNDYPRTDLDKEPINSKRIYVYKDSPYASPYTIVKSITGRDGLKKLRRKFYTSTGGRIRS